MRRTFQLLPLLLVASLTACNSNGAYQEDVLSCFDTYVTVKTKENVIRMQARTCEIIKEIDAISDAYKKREVTSVYDLNQTNDKLEVSFYLYDLLSKAVSYQEIAPNFNLMVGSLTNKWKESLEKEEVLSKTVILEELTKINNSSVILEKENDKYYAQRVGTGLIDVGAIAKGYALDRCQNYLHQYSDKNHDYLINAGNSSVLVGKKITAKVKDLSKDTFFDIEESFISTSGISEQKTIIDGVAYSHIINPKTGSAVIGSAGSLYDTVMVIDDNGDGHGALGDVLSTSLMMSTLDEIKEKEKELGFEVIVIKDDKVKYKSESLELR